MNLLVKIPSFEISTCQTWSNKKNQKKLNTLRSGILLNLDSKNEEIFNLICIFIYKGFSNSHSNAKEFHSLITEKILRYFSAGSSTLQNFSLSDMNFNRILKLTTILIDFYLKTGSRSSRMTEKISKDIIHECLDSLLDQSLSNANINQTKRTTPPQIQSTDALTCNHLFAFIDPNCGWLKTWMKNTTFRGHIVEILSHKDNKVFMKVVQSSIVLLSKMYIDRIKNLPSDASMLYYLYMVYSTSFVLTLIKYKITRLLFKKKPQLSDKKISVQDYLCKVVQFISKPCQIKLKNQDFEFDLSNLLYTQLICLSRHEETAVKCFFRMERTNERYPFTLRPTLGDLLEKYDYEAYRRQNSFVFFQQILRLSRNLVKYPTMKREVSHDRGLKRLLLNFLNITVQQISDSLVLDTFLLTFKLTKEIFTDMDSQVEMDLVDLLLDAIEINRELKLGNVIQERLNYLIVSFANSVRCLEVFIKDNLVNVIMDDVLFNPKMIIPKRQRKCLFYNLSQFQSCQLHFAKKGLYKSVIMTNLYEESFTRGLAQLLPLIAYPSCLKNALILTPRNNELILGTSNSLAFLFYTISPKDVKSLSSFPMRHEYLQFANQVLIVQSCLIEFSCFLLAFKTHLNSFLNDGQTVFDENNMQIQHLLARISIIGGNKEKYLPPLEVCDKCPFDNFINDYKQSLKYLRKQIPFSCRHMKGSSSKPLKEENHLSLFPSEISPQLWKEFETSPSILFTFQMTQHNLKDFFLTIMKRVYGYNHRDGDVNELKFIKVDNITKMAAIKFVNYGIFLGCFEVKHKRQYEIDLSKLLKYFSNLNEQSPTASQNNSSYVNCLICWIFLVTMGDQARTYQIYKELYGNVKEFEALHRIFQFKSYISEGKNLQNKNIGTLEVMEKIKITMQSKCTRICNILKLANIPEEQIIIHFLSQLFFNYLNYPEISNFAIMIFAKRFNLNLISDMFCGVISTQEDSWNRLLIDQKLVTNIRLNTFDNISIRDVVERLRQVP